MFPPVAIGQARLVSADLKLPGGFCLPAGAAALVPHHAMHSASFNWDKPNEFLPGSLSPPQTISLSLDGAQLKECLLYSSMPLRRQPLIGTVPKCIFRSVSGTECNPLHAFFSVINCSFPNTQPLMHWLSSPCILDTWLVPQAAE